MGKYDIESFLDFPEPKYMCAKCCALNCPNLPGAIGQEPIVCPVCRVEYVPTESFPRYRLDNYLGVFRFSELDYHRKYLARLGRVLRNRGTGAAPLAALYRVFQLAQEFVHFTTFGISHQIMGALK